jgi:hypothetical protein
MRFVRWLKDRGPYQSLLILAVPAAIVEPLKLGALAIVGSGHWLIGVAVMVCAYIRTQRLLPVTGRFIRRSRRYSNMRGWNTSCAARRGPAAAS